MSARDAINADLLAPDHVPVCPDCGDLAHPSATVCESCGTHLFQRAPRVQPLRDPQCSCGGEGICIVCVLNELGGIG